jgi:hypothetical protein
MTQPTTRMMLDLFAGFGGQSEPFVHDQKWDILRIDNNPLLSEVPRMRIQNIMEMDPATMFPGIEPGYIEYVHASPPCHQFSLGFHAPKAVCARACHDLGQVCDYHPKQGIEMALKAKAIIDALQPRFWSIENVKGSIKHLRPILGDPMFIVGPYVYWGRFPPVQIDPAIVPNKSTKDKRHSPLRSNYRALIPFVVADAFKTAIETQTRINGRKTEWS